MQAIRTVVMGHSYFRGGSGTALFCGLPLLGRRRAANATALSRLARVLGQRVLWGCSRLLGCGGGGSMVHASSKDGRMTLPSNSFSLFMAILIMALAVWALPGNTRLVLVLPVVLGAAWAFWKLRRSHRSRNDDAAEQRDEPDEAGASDEASQVISVFGRPERVRGEE
jgi:hypothetical protein